MAPKDHKGKPQRRSHLRWMLPWLGVASLVACFLSLAVTHHLSLLEPLNPVASALGGFSRGLVVPDEPEVTLTHDEVVALYPNVDPIDNPNLATIDGHDTFSACMLVNDDNHRLSEWLAYHYHILPLRYLVVAVDPRSKTSPTSILNAWREQGIFVSEWTDTDYWRSDLQPIPDDAEFQMKRDRHRGRQKFFYRKCLIHMQQHNRSWVSLHDSDEYLVYNHAGGEDYEAWEEHQQRKHDRIYKGKTRIKPSQTPPSTADEGAMIKYIRQEQAAGLAHFQSPCLGIPRLQFSAQESGDFAVRKNVPAFLDAHQFDTLRWRKHAPRNDFTRNALGKVLLDVSRVDVEKSPYFMSLHRPIKTVCSAPWHNEWEVGLRIQHYLGSWESYSFRHNDARRGGERSREQWEFKSAGSGQETDDLIRPWVGGFVATHGQEKSQQLLATVGLPRAYRPDQDAEWSLLPDKLAKILETNVTVANDKKLVEFDAFVRSKYANAAANAAKEQEEEPQELVGDDDGEPVRADPEDVTATTRRRR